MVSIVVLNEEGINIHTWKRKYDATEIELWLARKYSAYDPEQIMWQAFPDEVPLKVR
jgi:hypothetical protein